MTAGRSIPRSMTFTLLLLTGCTVQGTGQSPPQAGTRVVPTVDHHQHLISAGTMRMIARPGGEPQPPINAARVLQLLDSAGIRRAVVLSGAFTFGGRNFDRQQRTEAELHNLTRAENDWTASEVAKNPGRLIAFCSFHPHHSYALSELRRCAASGSFRGVKLHLEESDINLLTADHLDKVRAVFAEANRLRLSIVIHPRNNRVDPVASTRAFLTEVLPAAPDITVQIAHLSGGGQYSEPALALYADAVSSGDAVARNLIFDLTDVANTARESGDQAEGVMRRMVEHMRRIGIGRMVYGSDPAVFGRLAPREAWALFREVMPLTDAEIATIATNTAPYMR